jgi:hypothetical protein
MKRILMLLAGGVALAISVAIARKRRAIPMQVAELAGPDIIIDEIVVHFDQADPAF